MLCDQEGMNVHVPHIGVMGPRKANIMVETSKLPEHAGDHERLNFQKNIVENIVGVELDELSDEEDKKQEANVEKTSEKLGIAASPEVQSSQAQAPAGNLANPSRANNPEVAGTNLIGLAEVPPGDNPEGIGAQNNPDQVVAEIQASIQEEKAQQAEAFVKYMLTLGIQLALMFFVTGGASLAGSLAIQSLLYGLIAGVLCDICFKVWCLWVLSKKKPANARVHKLKMVVEGISLLKDLTLGVFIVGFIFDYRPLAWCRPTMAILSCLIVPFWQSA